jgi:hypothetical protein
MALGIINENNMIKIVARVEYDWFGDLLIAYCPTPMNNGSISSKELFQLVDTLEEAYENALILESAKPGTFIVLRDDE